MLDFKLHLNPNPKPLPFSQDNANLGFGQIFTDHIFVSQYGKNKSWGSSEILPYGSLALDPASSVLHYGQALFEGMKAFGRTDGSIWLFRPEYNWKRMCDGAERLCLPPPSREIFLEGLKHLVSTDRQWVPRSQGSTLYIRPTLIGSEAFLGLRPAEEAKFFIVLSPAGSYYAEGFAPLKIWLERHDVRAVPGGLGAVKAGANYAASLRASIMAKSKKCSQVLWLDSTHEAIEEVGTMNVFFVFKDEIVTPALNGSILPGCVRDSALQLLRSKHSPFAKKVSERRLTLAEITERKAKGELEECFGTGTAAVISPVGEICDETSSISISKEVGAVSQWLLATLQGIQWGIIEDSFSWMTRLEDLS